MIIIIAHGMQATKATFKWNENNSQAWWLQYGNLALQLSFVGTCKGECRFESTRIALSDLKVISTIRKSSLGSLASEVLYRTNEWKVSMIFRSNHDTAERLSDATTFSQRKSQDGVLETSVPVLRRLENQFRVLVLILKKGSLESDNCGVSTYCFTGHTADYLLC